MISIACSRTKRASLIAVKAFQGPFLANSKIFRVGRKDSSVANGEPVDKATKTSWPSWDNAWARSTRCRSPPPSVLAEQICKIFMPVVVSLGDQPQLGKPHTSQF